METPLADPAFLGRRPWRARKSGYGGCIFVLSVAVFFCWEYLVVVFAWLYLFSVLVFSLAVCGGALGWFWSLAFGFSRLVFFGSRFF
ncbi:hypothetical protein [Bifidobacterium adolescentis]|uniref:hypothetical protein n=1 Tax=Bifidobacterium adolescentis TaxID=1680 RepID=UPI0022E0030E|nr:hypothetical protein [Bifidobacterium adolescentis]